MPTYDYKCTACENRYEMREGFDAPSRQACPVCGGIAKRVLHAPPIVFKGSGFYITDSRKGSQATLADNTTPTAPAATSDGKSSNGASADSKPAAATSTTTSTSD